MKKSISYWSFEGGTDGKKNILECFGEAKKHGFEAVELCVSETGELDLDATREKCERILTFAKDTGIGISSLATGLLWDCSLTDSDPSVVEKAKGIVKKLLQIANWLRLDTVLVIPGAVDVFFKPDFKAVPYDVAYRRSLKAMRELRRTAEQLKVSIGIENVWNKFLLSPLEMKDFIDRCESRYVGAYFDVGNVVLFGFPEHWIRILGKRIKKVHLKDFKRQVGTVEGFCDLTEGDVNWKEVMKAFRDVGYDGFLTAEMMPLRPDLLEKTSLAMDRILGR